MLALFEVDSFFGETEVGRCARLYLHNDERGPVPGNQVKFTRTVFGTPVAGNDQVAQFLQKAMRQIFTARAPCMRGITSPQPRLVPEPIAQEPKAASWPHLP